MDPILRADLERFRAALEARFGPALVVVAAFGSQVHGTARPDSDLDVLVVARDLPRRRFDRHGVMAAVAREVGGAFAERVSVISLTPDEASTVKPFYLGLLDGHEVLADRDGFLRDILARLRRRLTELGARRLTDERGNGYWDLKPDDVLGEGAALHRHRSAARLFAERGHAFYGDEDDLVPPSEFFDRAEAKQALDAVERLLALYRELLSEPPPR